MKKYLILVKHSLPEIVESLPAREWKLSEIGKERAQRLVDQLQGYQPEVIISSVEPKAIQTAEIIAEKLGLPVYVVEGLHEHERSNVPFLPKDELQKAVKEFFSKPTELVFGDETAEQSYERFDQTVRSVLNYHHGKTVVLVAHGTVISLFVSRLTEIHDFSLWSELGLPSFVVIDLQAKTLIKKENIT
jgi:broad specificity phosphatase PhoE